MLHHHGSTERVASFLVTLVDRAEEEVRILALPMNRRDIADFLDMKVETVSRALAKLCEARVTELQGRSKILIRDIDGLKGMAG